MKNTTTAALTSAVISDQKFLQIKLEHAKHLGVESDEQHSVRPPRDSWVLTLGS